MAKQTMHPLIITMIGESEQWIEEVRGKSYFEKDIVEKTERNKELCRLWKKFMCEPHIIKMTKAVDEKVERYHADFFYHDLIMFEEYQGRFAWYVGDCGTHMIWLDNEDLKREESQRDWLDAVNRSYGSRYTLYEGSTLTGELKKTKFENLRFKIVKPLNRNVG